MTPLAFSKNFDGSEEIEAQVETGTQVSYPFGFITSILLKVPEHDSRWRQKDGNFFLDSGEEQIEMFTKLSEPLFFKCPRRGEGHYVLTPRGEELAQYFESRDTNIEESQIATAEIIDLDSRRKAA